MGDSVLFDEQLADCISEFLIFPCELSKFFIVGPGVELVGVEVKGRLGSS